MDHSDKIHNELMNMELRESQKFIIDSSEGHLKKPLVQ